MQITVVLWVCIRTCVLIQLTANFLTVTKKKETKTRSAVRVIINCSSEKLSSSLNVENDEKKADTVKYSSTSNRNYFLIPITSASYLITLSFKFPAALNTHPTKELYRKYRMTKYWWFLFEICREIGSKTCCRLAEVCRWDFNNKLV